MNVIKTYFKYTKALRPLIFSNLKYIALHHTVSFNTTPEEIHRWHLNRGFIGFGYNEYIRKDGTVYIGRGDHAGAHVENMNSISYGIALEGNYDIEKEIPEAQYNALIARLKYNKGRFPESVEVVEHSRLNATTCAGRYFPLEGVLKDLEKEPVVNIDQALKILHEVGLTKSTKYWKRLSAFIKYFDVFIIGIADYIDKHR